MQELPKEGKEYQSSKNKKKFEIDLSDGKIGENILYGWLLSQHKTIRNVIYVDDDKRCRQNDIDFIIQDYKGQIHYAELKTDFYADFTGNIALEWISNKCFNTLGWLQTTKADIIYILTSTNHNLYVCDTSVLRKYVEENKSKLKYKETMNSYSTFYCIPVNDLLNKKLIKKFERII